MSVQVAQDSFTRSAGKQLLVYGLLSILGVIVLMLGLSWASGQTGTATGTGQAVDPATNTISILMAEEPPQLNSTLATDTISGMVLGHIMEGLLTYDQHNRLAPGIAETWEIGEYRAVFNLRRSALWSDGKPVTAHDFVFAWRKTLDPEIASQYAFIMYPIKNAEAINKGEMPGTDLGVRAIDDYTLEVDLERPIAYFDKLVAFSTYLPMREDFFNSTSGKYAADADMMLFNGPFRLTTWVHGARLRFEKNQTYWRRDEVRLDAIDVPYITTDTNAPLNLFKDNKVAYTSLTAENLQNALERRWHLNRFQDGSVSFIEFNHRPDRLTNNIHLRKAMQMAQDSSELVYKVTKLPGYLPGESLFPVWLRGVNDFFRVEYPAPVVKLNLEEARRHLELAKADLNLKEFPPLVLLTGDNPISNILAEYFQGVFKKNLGLDMKIDKQIFKQRLAKMASGEFDLVLAGWGPDFDDPLTFGDLFASWNLNNRGRYDSPALDAQVRIAQNSVDPKTRMDAFGEIQRILIEDAVILPSYERGVVYVTHPHLKGLVRRAVGADPNFVYAWIDTQ
ncbi:MAG: peptide ABC transporter substrate-binding protein [Proteobacteria bacterium]|nr:peptide ABC transporter substrate-binding protein [Pseudomonadota bacterium]